VFERIEKMCAAKFSSAVEQLPEADRDKVKKRSRKCNQRSQSRSEKLEKEAKEKIEATYQKLMSI
jgi:hypothetical protein